MQITLADVISKATTLAGGRRDWAVSEVSFFANLAAVAVYQQVYHTPLESLAVSSTTSGENRITVPTDYEATISLSNLSTPGVNSGQMGGRQLTKAEGAYLSSQWTASGTPIYYADYGTWLELWPSPDSSYSLELRYYAKLPSLLTSTQTPAFDERWHPGCSTRRGNYWSRAGTTRKGQRWPGTSTSTTWGASRTTSPGGSGPRKAVGSATRRRVTDGVVYPDVCSDCVA